jgi:hypothetical protein
VLPRWDEWDSSMLSLRARSPPQVGRVGQVGKVGATYVRTNRSHFSFSHVADHRPGQHMRQRRVRDRFELWGCGLHRAAAPMHAPRVHAFSLCAYR